MAVAPINIDYDLGEHGWSRFVLTVGDRNVEVGAFSYCTDALGDLLRAALTIASGGYRAETSFDGEPVEWRLILQRDWRAITPNTFDIKIVSFADIYARQPEAEGHLEFEAQVDGDAFARAIAHAAQTIWDQHGSDGYNRLWGGSEGFPLRALGALQRALELCDPRPATPDPSDFVFEVIITANDS
ncbi:MAG: hypothetical protein J7521_13010 [Caulobacter sp.]|nr:hypothetical protein [Caulobacter sp.]